MIDFATYVTYRTLSDNWEIIPLKAIGCPLTLIPIHSRVVNRDICYQSGMEPDDRIFDDPKQEDSVMERAKLLLNNSWELAINYYLNRINIQKIRVSNSW